MSSKTLVLVAAGIIAVMVVGAVMIVGCGKQPIAVVGQEKITRAQLTQKLEEDFGRQALMSMVTLIILKQEFEEQGLTINPDDVQEALERLKKQAGSPQAFARSLAKQGTTEPDLMEQIKLEMMVEKLCKQNVNATEANLREFFENNKEDFDMSRRIGYSEIVVGSKEEADKLVDQLKNSDADFATLAKQHSINLRTRPQGGKVAPRPPEHIGPPEIQKTLEQLEPAQISGPLQAGQHWYIVKLDEVLPQRQAEFEKDHDRIVRAYEAQHAKRPQQLLRELQQEASVNIVAPEYSDLNDVFKPPSELPKFGQQQGARKGAVGPSGPQKPGQARPGGTGAKQKRSVPPEAKRMQRRSGGATRQRRSSESKKPRRQGSAGQEPAQPPHAPEE